MTRPKKKSREQLISAVKDCKRNLKILRVVEAKRKFFDKYYKRMDYAGYIRLDNLWACKITDSKFTKQLEEFLLNNLWVNER